MHDSKELTYLKPRIKLISTINEEVEISYKRKNPSGFFARFNGSDDKIKNNEIINKRFHLNKGVETIRFYQGWSQPGEWRLGTYEFIFYIDNKEYYTQKMTVK